MASCRVVLQRGHESAVLLSSGVGFRLRGLCRCKLSTHSASHDQQTNSLKSIRKHKKRLDELCQERFPQYSRSMIQSWILQGKVLVDGQPIGKAGASILSKSDVKIIAEVPKYVCRAGYKLEAAIEHFRCDITGKVALDAGLSTGGFADCLLQAGAAYVYGVDVGYGQVAEKIRIDERVHILERTNLRHLSSLPQLVDVATLDLSFISILLVMPAVRGLMKTHSTLITLIKPQFEARRSQVVKSPFVDYLKSCSCGAVDNIIEANSKDGRYFISDLPHSISINQALSSLVSQFVHPSGGEMKKSSCYLI